MVNSGLCNASVRQYLGSYGPMESGHLTTCFIDIVLIPLPSFLFLLTLPLIAFVGTSYSVRATPKTKTKEGIKWIQRFLLIALFLMNLLEIIRLRLSNAGIGILPITLFSTFLAIVLVFMREGMCFGRQRFLNYDLVGFFGFWMIFEIVKVNSLILVERQELPGLGPSMYLNADKSLDNYVILGLLIVHFLREVFLAFKSKPNLEGELDIDALKEEKLQVVT